MKNINPNSSENGSVAHSPGGSGPAGSVETVRMVDIARAAGVSRQAVSRVLFPNGSRGVRVGEKTAEKVRQIAERMGYMPNLSAKQLAGEGSKLIGVLIDSFASPAFYDMIQQLERSLAVSGYRLLIGQVHEDVNSIADYLRDFAGRGVEGVVSYVHSYPGFTDVIRDLCRSVGNIIFVGAPKVEGGDQVMVDTAEGIRLLVRHLHETGRRRIALYLPKGGYPAVVAREQGFRDELARLGLDASSCPVWFHDRRKEGEPGRNPSREIIQDGLVNLIANHPDIDALIASNDLIALCAIQFFTERGIRVPGQIAVAGFDNMELSAFASPSITSVDQCPATMAERISRLLLSRLQDKSRPYETYYVKPKIVIRNSTGLASMHSSDLRHAALIPQQLKEESE